jgi:hypothetical protein
VFPPLKKEGENNVVILQPSYRETSPHITNLCGRPEIDQIYLVNLLEYPPTDHGHLSEWKDLEHIPLNVSYHGNDRKIFPSGK